MLVCLIKADPIKISIDSVTILCSLCSQNPTPETLINMKIHMLKAYKYFRKCYILAFLHIYKIFVYIF